MTIASPPNPAMVMDVTEREYQQWFESDLAFYIALFIAFEQYNATHYFPEAPAIERRPGCQTPAGFLNNYHTWLISLPSNFWETYLEDINPAAAFNFHLVRNQLRTAGRNAMLERAGGA